MSKHLLFFLLLFGAPAFATEYHVAVNGSDSNDGSWPKAD